MRTAVIQYRETIITASLSGFKKKFQLYPGPAGGLSPVVVVVVELESGLSGMGATEEDAITDAFKRLGIN